MGNGLAAMVAVGSTSSDSNREWILHRLDMSKNCARTFRVVQSGKIVSTFTGRIAGFGIKGYERRSRECVQYESEELARAVARAIVIAKKKRGYVLNSDGDEYVEL